MDDDDSEMESYYYEDEDGEMDYDYYKGLSRSIIHIQCHCHSVFVVDTMSHSK